MNIFDIISINKGSLGVFSDTVKYSNLMKDNEKKELAKLNLSEIIQVDFPDSEYHRKQTNKKQIVIHHTVSGIGVHGDIRWWRQNTSRIGTSIIVGHDGKIYQCFSSKYWAHHLGIKQKVFNEHNIININNTELNQSSIGIEIDSWGGLVKARKYWYPAKWNEVKKIHESNTSVDPIKNIVEFPKGYRGFYAYEKYTDEQIESTRQLLEYWSKIHNITTKYNEDMWDVSLSALKGKEGIWTHNSYRADKSDCYPDERLIKMLKNLT